jgi:Cu/Ag efflux pump CusA
MIAKLVAAAVRAPVVVAVLVLALIGIGLRSYQVLAIEAYPNPVALMIEIIAQPQGWSAEEVERYVSLPLETGLVVTYARQLRESGHTAEESALFAAQRRLRPVLMSTFVAMLGLLPAAVLRGIGSETQKPLAIVVIGGALALVILPRLLPPAPVMLAHRKRPACTASYVV